MAHLLHLAGSGTADLVIAGPFMLIVLLHRMCALWRDWAATRTYAAHQAALRTHIASTAHVAEEQNAGAVTPGSDAYEPPRATASTPAIASPLSR